MGALQSLALKPATFFAFPAKRLILALRLEMAAKKDNPDMPANIPGLLLVSGDIINPMKLLMDTAGQIVGGRSTGQDREEATTRQGRTRQKKCKDKRHEKTSERKRSPNHQQQQEEEGKSNIASDGKINQKERREIPDKPRSQQKRYMPHQGETDISINSNKTLYPDDNLDMRSSELINSETPFSYDNADKSPSPNRRGLRTDISMFPQSPSKAEMPRMSRRKSAVPHNAELKATPFTAEMGQRRRLSVPTLFLDEPWSPNHLSKSLNRIAIGNPITFLLYC